MKFQFIDLYLLIIDRKIFLYLLILYEKSYQMITWILKKRKRFLIQDSYALRVPEKYRKI